MATSDSIVSILKSVVHGRRPANDVEKAGQPYVNFADKQFGVMDTHGKAIDLLAVRLHSATAKYKVNDMVFHTNQLYIAKHAINPKAFAIADWTAYSSQGAIGPSLTVGTVTATTGNPTITKVGTALNFVLKTGATGLKGATGLTGGVGHIGPRGATGAAGPALTVNPAAKATTGNPSVANSRNRLTFTLKTGATGARGATGATGHIGTPGAKGATGARGATGAKAVVRSGTANPTGGATGDLYIQI